MTWQIFEPCFAERLRLLHQLVNCDIQLADHYLENSGEEMILKALHPVEGRRVLIAARNYRPRTQITWEDVYGAMSFGFYFPDNVDPDGPIKRVNTGVVSQWQGSGIGTAMVKVLCNRFPNRPQYSHSLPKAWGWCEKLGMERDTALPDGRCRFRMGVSRVRELAKQI